MHISIRFAQLTYTGMVRCGGNADDGHVGENKAQPDSHLQLASAEPQMRRVAKCALAAIVVKATFRHCQRWRCIGLAYGNLDAHGSRRADRRIVARPEPCCGSTAKTIGRYLPSPTNIAKRGKDSDRPIVYQTVAEPKKLVVSWRGA